MEKDPRANMIVNGSSRGRARHGKSRKHEETPLDDSSSC